MNVTLPARTPVDLYAATGFTIGAQLTSINLTSGDVRLSVLESELTSDHVVIGPYMSATNDDGDAGAWAMSVSGGSINVKEV